MVVAIKIIIWVVLLYYVFKTIFIDLFVAFYDPATETAVQALEKRGLKNYVKSEAICDFFKHFIIIFILVRILCGTIEYTKSEPENNKQTFKVELRNDN